MKKTLKWLGIVLAVLLILGLIVPLGVKFFGWYWGWAFNTGDTRVEKETVTVSDNSSDDITDSPSDPVVAQVDSGIIMDFGVFGVYKAVYDSNRDMNTLGWWNGNLIEAGAKNLADLKREGATITFEMPADGWINNSAGELFVDGKKWDLGNYGENPQEETMILAGQTVTVSYGPNNDSAGFQLWFAND